MPDERIKRVAVIYGGSPMLSAAIEALIKVESATIPAQAERKSEPLQIHRDNPYKVQAAMDKRNRKNARRAAQVAASVKRNLNRKW